ncbi:MAG TPA: putative DNA-binding domain-containing protein [Methylophilaceae bacterium]|nr:putative DNA-binding domain-containing protein [Methylophilaceae bacterium]
MSNQQHDAVNPLPAFQAYQRQFTQHIRDPKNQPQPANVPAKRMAIYTEIVYNNIEGTLASCFPVTKKILSVRRWQQLVRGFMAHHQASTPFFREIPEQFLMHLENVKKRLQIARIFTQSNALRMGGTRAFRTSRLHQYG